MDLSNLKPAKGSIKKNTRLGRGQGSARGGTSGRGHKGQQSRSGYSKKIGFEGGQQPIQRRLPKFGFTNINRVEFKGINLDTLQLLAETKKLKKIGKEDLVSNGLAAKKDLIKILGRGELTTKIDVSADAFSKSALAVLEKLGGKIEILREVKEKKKKRRKKKSAPKPEAKADAKEEAVEKEEEKTEVEAVENTNENKETGNGEEVKEETPADESDVAEAEAPAKEEEAKEETPADESADLSSEAEAKDEAEAKEEEVPEVSGAEPKEDKK